MGITVYGTSVDTPIERLVIDGNEIYDCDPHPSEALVLNGNVTNFEVTNNFVHDVNNIGIDFIGGETDINPDPTKVARNGVCRGNRIYRANQKGGGFAGAIYVDGGRDLVIEQNWVSESDLGIEIGAENPGIVTSGVVVRSNVVFRNNTLFENDTLGKGFGEVWIQYASGNVVVSTAQDVLVYSDAGNTDNDLDYNLWDAPGGEPGARFVWNGAEYVGFEPYRVGTGEDAASLFADPVLVDPEAGDVHLAVGSPAMDAGNPVDGDGCDSNCTVTGCGNGIVTPGEACDDSNTLDGDCCSGTCQLEPEHTSCDDGKLCTTADVCSGGVCVGAEAPAPLCRLPTVPGRSRLFVKDAEDDRSDRLVWRWTRGEETNLADFGDPSSSTSYAFCVYDSSGGSPSVLLETRAPAGGSCGGKPCWQTIPAGGFRYADRAGTPDGLARLLLRTGSNGAARIVLRGKGAFLPEPRLPPAQDPEVVVQVHNTEGVSWEARYSTPALQSEADRFRDRSD
jgi:cysteine-rich repeat protein